MSHNVIIYFDIAAVVVMSISLASLLLRRPMKDAANRVYLTAMILVTVTAIIALAGEVYDAFIGPSLAQAASAQAASVSAQAVSAQAAPASAPAAPASAQAAPAAEPALAARSALATVYFTLRSLMAPTYFILVATISDTTHRLNDNNAVRFFLWVPMIAVALLILSNPVHHFVFTFEGGVMQRGLFMQVLYAEAAYYTVTGIIWLVYWRKLFSTTEFVTLAVLYPVMIAATVFQYYEQELRLEMFITSIAMMLVSAFAIHPETRHDANMDAASLSAYREMTRRAFITRKHLCLVYIEIVNMDQLRELVGRVELQDLMRGVSRGLSRTLERDDMLYYLHNGAFCISPRSVDAAHALNVAKQAHARGKAKALASHAATVPEMRSCIVRIPEDIDDPVTLKDFGRGLSRLVPASTVTTYQELAKRDDFELQMALPNVISQAIENRSFEVHYQPIYCLHDGRFHSAEALVRLNDPKLGWVPPSLFIPEAEQSGAIVDIGTILLEKICAFLGSIDYRALGLDYVEVNLSVDQCIRPEMAGELLGLMEAHGVDPSRVNVEITETSATYSQQIIEENVRALAEAGVTLSLDDYGTGYSNITRMLSLPFSLVKVDKSLADKLDDAATRRVLADTVTTMKAIGKSVLVEGVESHSQVEVLSDMGVDYIQGFYFAKPMPQDDFVSFLA